LAATASGRRPAMKLSLDLVPETERRLRERATERGQSLEGFIEQLIERATLDTSTPTPAELTPLSLEEFDRLLDEVSEGLPPLPPLPDDFSRADIYADHD
jgi:hypothetical protein